MDLLSLLRILLFATSVVSSVAPTTDATDPCAYIGGKKWVSPREVRACFRSVEVDENAKTNIIEVIKKTSAFHTSVNYEIRAPPPFDRDVHEDLLADLSRIQQQYYSSDFDLHIDISRTVKPLFVNYLPVPLSLLTAHDGTQDVYISPEAFQVASAEFSDEIEYWQNELPGELKGNLAVLSGAKVLEINGKDPWEAIDANAEITGVYLAYGTRQRSFFSSYSLNATGKWQYIMGDFAQQSLPLSDSVSLTLKLPNQYTPVYVELPYRSRLGLGAIRFTDTASWRSNNCLAINGTNGADLYSSMSSSAESSTNALFKKSRQSDFKSTQTRRKQPRAVILGDSAVNGQTLPLNFQSLKPLNGSRNQTQFYMLNDGKTGVLAVGSFNDDDFDAFLQSMLQGFSSLKSLGATRLIIDMSNNAGGFVCLGVWLHRTIVGSKSRATSLDGKIRGGLLAQLIVKEIVYKNADPDQELFFNGGNTGYNTQGVLFTPQDDWIQPVENITINSRQDSFSPRLGQMCDPDYSGAPSEGFFDPKNIMIASNGKCASTCCMFAATMAEIEGVRTVFFGGKEDVQQEYCTAVAGQVLEFADIDNAIKTTGLKNHFLAPPDLIVNGLLSVNFRLAYGLGDSSQPAEWQPRLVDWNLAITRDIVNKPEAIWNKIARDLF